MDSIFTITNNSNSITIVFENEKFGQIEISKSELSENKMVRINNRVQAHIMATKIPANVPTFEVDEALEELFDGSYYQTVKTLMEIFPEDKTLEEELN